MTMPNFVKYVPPTARQAEVLAYIRKFMRKNQCAPTIREIGIAIGEKSPNGVERHLIELERQGLIARSGKINRGIRILGNGTCPFCGK